MKLYLVLALALLGAVSARQLHEGHLKQEGTAEQDEVKPGEPEPPCPTESESFRMTVPGEEGRTYRYVAVNNCQSFWRAQCLCARCYRGRLASVHSHWVNEHLRKVARCRTNRGQVWIGGITTRRNRCWRSRWIDRSPWNYAYWASGNVQRFRSCVALCTAGGHWRNVHCRTRLPFICEY
ncbi:bone marrow proteoglycan [Emydura macquarii macquarii]|uniref:bone marrow proteoglycan n=1 Tax=Emydura macquarii macquarii TaxID=1129001 RepID=UPI00352B8BA3